MAVPSLFVCRSRQQTFMVPTLALGVVGPDPRTLPDPGVRSATPPCGPSTSCRIPLIARWRMFKAEALDAFVFGGAGLITARALELIEESPRSGIFGRQTARTGPSRGILDLTQSRPSNFGHH